MSFDDAKLEQPIVESPAPAVDLITPSAPEPSAPSDGIRLWIAALEGVQDKLEAGCRVADLESGPGESIIVLARAYPRSHFFGFDLSVDQVEAARQAARRAGVIAHMYFQPGSANDFPGWGFDLVTLFGGLCNLAHPIGAARRVRTALSPDGTWLIVEPTGSEERVRQVVEAAGFTRFRRVVDSASNQVFEVRL
jgi:cyclopropane fatty-acyl-phospholipid synthase-like methyltransferase